MQLCEGCAAGPGQVQPCPDARNDSTVRGRQGELVLCVTPARNSGFRVALYLVYKSSVCHSPSEGSKLTV